MNVSLSQMDLTSRTRMASGEHLHSDLEPEGEECEIYQQMAGPAGVLRRIKNPWMGLCPDQLARKCSHFYRTSYYLDP
jgi:hypothetical protein